MQKEQAPTLQSQSRIVSPAPRRKGRPSGLRIDTPAQNSHIVLAQEPEIESASSSTAPLSTTTSSPVPLSPATSESEPSSSRPSTTASARNMKKLSLMLPSEPPSSGSGSMYMTALETGRIFSPLQDDDTAARRRRPSVISLPNPSSINPLLHRREEEEGTPAPYLNGPEQILPGIWLGSEDNARDYPGLIERGIKSILNVAQEVASPFDAAIPQAVKQYVSTPNLKQAAKDSVSTYYPASRATGRPGMHYLKLQWSHGQQDLVENGFLAAMSFVDGALAREEGVLIHCQCGISRSATLMIALVMRAASQMSPHVPPEIWELKGMHAAYAYVKEKSKWVSPNMSLMYQLLDYERKLQGVESTSPSARSSGLVSEEEEWGRRRQMLDETSEDDYEQDFSEVMLEARALDRAMEDRVVARKSSASSMSSGVGMGSAWRSRYGDCKRAGSIVSTKTTGSIFSENLIEEDEERELLGVGGDFDSNSDSRRSSLDVSSADSKDDRDSLIQPPESFTPATARPRLVRAPPSAPVTRTSFPYANPPATAFRSSFDVPTMQTLSKPKLKRRPPPIAVLPPVPPSPVSPVEKPARPPRARTESRKPAMPPPYLRSSHGSLPQSKNQPAQQLPLPTPSQTLFVFPPSPTTRNTRTPATMTLMSSAGAVPFPAGGRAPRVSTSRAKGRARSFIALGVCPTPTTACSRVDAQGWMGQK